MLKKIEEAEQSPLADDADDTPIVQMTRDAVGVITSVNEAIVALLGWQPEQLIGSASTNWIHPADQPGAVAAWTEMISVPGRSGIWRGRYKTKQGPWKWVETENRLDDGDVPQVLSSMREVDPHEASLEEQFQAREQLLAQLSDALPVGVFQVDLAGRVTLTNESLHVILGLPQRDSFRAQMATVVDDDLPTVEAALANAFACHSVDGLEVRLRVPTGESAAIANRHRVCLLSLRPLTDGAGVVSGAVGCLSDVTDRARLHEELRIRASVDGLTSCFNRAATIELVEQTMSARDNQLGLALVFADLDRLKVVNDELGHGAGDQLIVAAATRIKDALRVCDAVGRLGGDEFLVICPRVLSAEDAVEIAERISSALTTSVKIGSAWIELRASVGVVWTTERLDADTLIARADRAMYQSKRVGHHGVTLFAEADQVGRADASSAIDWEPRHG